MSVVKKIRNDWAAGHKARTGAVEGKPWGWQWGGRTVYQQVCDMGIADYLHSPVLDVGCGGGKWEKWFIDDFRLSVTGVDVHEEALKEAREYEPRAHYQLINGEDFTGFGSRTFNTVFIFDVLLHLPAPLVMKYFQEAHRVSSKNLIISLPDMGAKKGGERFLESVKRRPWREPNLFFYGYMSYYTRGQVARMMNLAGWQNIKLLGHIGARGDRDMVVVGYK